MICGELVKRIISLLTLLPRKSNNSASAVQVLECIIRSFSGRSDMPSTVISQMLNIDWLRLKRKMSKHDFKLAKVLDNFIGVNI